MKKNQIKESGFLFSIFIWILALSLASDGTFTHFTMGTWSGYHIQVAGWLLAVGSMYSIISHIRLLWESTIKNLILVSLFIVILILCGILLFICVEFNWPSRPFFFIIPLIIFGHYLHKTLSASH